MRKFFYIPFIALVLATPVQATEYNPDPWEGFNRKMFSFNEKMDTYALRPMAVGYHKVTNQPVRSSVSNFFSNLGELKVIVSDLLQLKIGQAASDTGRFVVNSTLGFFGLFDVATHFGLKEHDEDFGQALGYWGVGSGPYVMWPFLGPSTVRDSAGMGLQYAANVSMINFGRNATEDIAIGTFYAVSVRADLLDAEGLIQGDKYTFIRSFYLQRRAYLINEGRKMEEDFGDDDWDDFDE